MTDLRFYFPERGDLDEGHYAQMLYGQEWPENWPVGFGKDAVYTTGHKPRVVIETQDEFLGEVSVKPQGEVYKFTNFEDYYDFVKEVEDAVADRRYLRSLSPSEEREVLAERERQSRMAQERIDGLIDKDAERKAEDAIAEGEMLDHSFEDDITATEDDYINDGCEDDFDPNEY